MDNQNNIIDQEEVENIRDALLCALEIISSVTGKFNKLGLKYGHDDKIRMLALYSKVHLLESPQSYEYRKLISMEYD